MPLPRLFWTKKHEYAPLDQKFTDDVMSNGIESQVSPPRSYQPSAIVFFFASLGILILSILILIVAVTRIPTQLECARITSPYSPLWDAVEFWEGDFTNDFFHETVYRGAPNREREAAWDKLWRHGIIGIPEAGIAALNKTDSRTHHKTLSSGQGPEYGAMLEVYHQLHCLNLIRQFTYLDHYDKSDPGIIYPADLLDAHPKVARLHVDHCIETLRLSFMCYSDVTPLLFDLEPEEKIGRIADFNVHHKCRDFDKISDWVEENQVHLDYSLVHSNVPQDGHE